MNGGCAYFFWNKKIDPLNMGIATHINLWIILNSWITIKWQLLSLNWKFFCSTSGRFELYFFLKRKTKEKKAIIKERHALLLSARLWKVICSLLSNSTPKAYRLVGQVENNKWCPLDQLHGIFNYSCVRLTTMISKQTHIFMLKI